MEIKRESKSLFSVFFVLLLTVFIYGCYHEGGPYDAANVNPTPSPFPQPAPTPSPNPIAPSQIPTTQTITPSEKIVEISGNRFSPQVTTIKVGDTVKFINRDSTSHWPASDVHPTHRAYPEGGGCTGSAFDSCKGLGSGESYSFTFNVEGNWDYHCHIHPDMKGIVVVTK